jgi:tetratricopeptide (TPR) repeat protein
VRGTIGRLDGIWFRDHACGANRVDKYERDARLLVASHRRDPTSTRTMFYLGQTYKDLARHDEAIRWYQKRVDAGDWEEERWYARYMIALCHLRRGDEAAFVHAALAAYEARPSRAEPLYLLAQAYRKKGEHASALIMADAAARIPYPSADRLFVEDFVYRTGIDEELSIAAFYATDPGVKRRGYEACMRLVADPRTPEEARATALANAVFYARSAADCLRALVVELAEEDAALPPTLTVEIEGGAVSIEPLGPALHRALRLGPDGARLRASDPFVFVGSSGERVTAVARVPGTKRLVVTLLSREAAGESERSYAVSFDESSILAWIEGSADPPIQGCAEPARAPSKDANPMRGAR